MHAPVVKDLVLVGGGHSHVAVLKQFGMQPLPGARVTLISRDSQTPYSGMLPGLIAGHYSADEAHIDLVPLCRFAGARFVRADVIGIDTAAATVQLANRPPIAYDVVSINVGSTPALPAGLAADGTVLPVKPIDRFLTQWKGLLERVRARRERTRIAVVGGGAGGVELILAVRQKLGAERCDVSLSLLTAGRDILTAHGAGVRRRFRRILAEHNIDLHTQAHVVAADPGRLCTDSGQEFRFDEVLWVTEAAAAPWLAVTGIAVDDRGFALVDEYLRSVSHPQLFAAGDAAAMRGEPRPKSGVFAVRQGAPLARNLRRALLGKKLVAFRPQRRFLSLIGTGEGYAVASRGAWSAEGRWVWRWKEWIDRRFMRKYQVLPAMSAPGTRIARSQLLDDLPAELRDDGMRCGGCGAKVGADVLSEALAGFEPAPRADIVLGLGARDDAAAVALPEGALAVLSVDAFRPMLDDPYLFGRIAANHCLGDLFAVGAEAQTALAIATLPLWPESKLVAELRQMLAGAIDVLGANGAALVGGHTSEGAELSLGFAVTGWIARERLMTKIGLRPGDQLIVTKPLGTGALLAANMRARAKGRWIDAAVETMLQSSRDASEILRAHGAAACTDITGFGLAGHLLEMIGRQPKDARAAALAIHLDLRALPALDGARQSIDAGIVSTLHAKNERANSASISDQLRRHRLSPLLFDPQTAGGLLAGVPSERAAACLSALREAGYTSAAVIGRVVPGTPGGRMLIDGLT